MTAERQPPSEPLEDLRLEKIAQLIRCGESVDAVRIGCHIIPAKDEDLAERLRRHWLAKGDLVSLRLLNRALLLFSIQARSTVMRSMPIHLQIEHTTFCNARCIMCDHAIALNRGSRHLTPELLLRLEPLLPFAEEVVLHGNGEPLLNPHLPEILDIYRRCNLRVSLNTNLSVLDKGIAATLGELCDTLHVSCDGCTKNVYEGIRRGLDFGRFLSNLRLLNTIAPHMRKTLEVVVMRQNVLTLPNLVEFAAVWGFDTVKFNPLGANGAIGNEDDAPGSFPRVARALCERAQRKAEQLGITVLFPSLGEGEVAGEREISSFAETVRFPDEALFETLRTDNPTFTNIIARAPMTTGELTDSTETPIEGICEYPFGKTYIDLEGNVSVCCELSRRPLGRISDQTSFSAIWNGKRYQALRRSYYGKSLPTVCQGCGLESQGALAFMRKD